MNQWKIMSGVALLLAAASILIGVFLYSRIQDQRRDSITLMCDQNDVLREFIEAPPDRPRDRRALRRLREEKCDRLLQDLGARPVP